MSTQDPQEPRNAQNPYETQTPQGQYSAGTPYGGAAYGGAPYGGAPYGGPRSGQIPTGPDGRPPLWAPWYGISFGAAIRRFFAKYARFDGRASRSEYWWWTLANGIVVLVLYGIFMVLLFTTLSDTASTTTTTGSSYNATTTGTPSPLAFIPLGLLVLWWLATIVPNLALGWRRVHDAGMAGPLWIIAVFVGIVAIVFGCLEPNPNGAQYDRPDHG